MRLVKQAKGDPHRTNKPRISGSLHDAGQGDAGRGRVGKGGVGRGGAEEARGTG